MSALRPSKGPRIFEVTAAVDASGAGEIEVPPLPWAYWGQPGNILMIGSGIDPDRKTDFKVVITFSKDRRGEFPGNLSPTSEHVAASGDSFYAISDDDLAAYIGNGEQTIKFTPVLNAEKRLAGMESDLIRNVTLDDAIEAARQFARKLERILCVMTKIPLFAETVHVRSADTLQSYTRANYAYPTIQISTFMTPELPCMSPLLSVYAEGMRESAESYRFLCFFKLADKVLNNVNPTLQRLAETYGLTRPDMNPQLPADPFELIAPGAVGKKYTAIRDELRERFRNVIAHLDLNSPVEPFNVETESEVAKSAMVLAYIAEELLRKAYDFLLQLKEAGHEVETLRFQ